MWTKVSLKFREGHCSLLCCCRGRGTVYSNIFLRELRVVQPHVPREPFREAHLGNLRTLNSFRWVLPCFFSHDADLTRRTFFTRARYILTLDINSH